MAIALIFLVLIAIYLLVFLLPLDWIARKVRLCSFTHDGHVLVVVS